LAADFIAENSSICQRLLFRCALSQSSIAKISAKRKSSSFVSPKFTGEK